MNVSISKSNNNNNSNNTNNNDDSRDAVSHGNCTPPPPHNNTTTTTTTVLPSCNSSISSSNSTGIVLVVGHEKTGVCDAIMQRSHHIVEIPTYGMKNSLNVVTATSIMLFEILRQWNNSGVDNVRGLCM